MFKLKRLLKIKFIIPLVIFIAALVYWAWCIQLPPAQSVQAQLHYTGKVLLVPLDTRPPCQKMVIDAGKMAQIEAAVPPSQIMDYYTQPGDTKATRQWLLDNINNSDGAIISVDQLLHGGLLASRESGTKDDESQQLIDFLRRLKAKAPDKPLYVFSILPRITPPPTLDSSSKKIIKLSRLTDEISVFGNRDDIKLAKELLEDDDVKSSDWQTYLDLFRRNTQLNKQLIALAKEGVITKFVIGQDDGEDFGVPNMEKRALNNFCHSIGATPNEVMITKGADETALSLLASFVQKRSDYQPNIYVEYNDKAASSTIMPFMAGSVGSTVQEKLRLASAKEAASPDKADLILYVFIGNRDNLSTRRQSAQKINEYIAQGKQVALVDLSYHFAGSECVFSQLLDEDVPLNTLNAYAGWNTASNSIGTALADALIYQAAKTQVQTTNDVLALEYTRLCILYSRILEDYYYLKDTIDAINTTLTNHGYTNVNDLDMEHNYRWMNELLSQAMQRRADALWHTDSARIPLEVSTPDGTYSLVPRYIQAETFFPWPRTFEIYMNARLNLYDLK